MDEKDLVEGMREYISLLQKEGRLFNWWRLCLCSGQPRRKRGNRRHCKTSDEERCR